MYFLNIWGSSRKRVQTNDPDSSTADICMDLQLFEKRISEWYFSAYWCMRLLCYYSYSWCLGPQLHQSYHLMQCSAQMLLLSDAVMRVRLTYSGFQSSQKSTGNFDEICVIFVRQYWNNDLKNEILEERCLPYSFTLSSELVMLSPDNHPVVCLITKQMVTPCQEIGAYWQDITEIRLWSHIHWFPWFGTNLYTRPFWGFRYYDQNNSKTMPISLY